MNCCREIEKTGVPPEGRLRNAECGFENKNTVDVVEE